MTRTQCHTCDVLVKQASAWGNDAALDPEQKMVLQNSAQPFSTVPGRIETPYQLVEKLSDAGQGHSALGIPIFWENWLLWEAGQLDYNLCIILKFFSVGWRLFLNISL